MIDTDRLHLRPNVLADLEAMHALTLPDEMRRFLSPGPPSLEASFARLMLSLAGWATHGYGSFAAIERATGAYVGNLGLFEMVRSFAHGDEHWTEAGWVISADHWGRGYAGEATAAVHAWFDGAHGPGRTTCIIVPGNGASERIAARLGYRPFGDAEHKGDVVRMYERLP